MGADGVDADVELLRDLFILHAGGQVVDDPPLLLGQGVVGVIQILGQVLGLAGDEHKVPGLDQARRAGGEKRGVIKGDVPGRRSEGLTGSALGGQTLADLVDHGLDLPELGVSLVIAPEEVALVVPVLLPEDLADLLGRLVGLHDRHVLVEDHRPHFHVLEKELEAVMEPGLPAVAEIVLVVGLHQLRQILQQAPLLFPKAALLFGVKEPHGTDHPVPQEEEEDRLII